MSSLEDQGKKSRRLEAISLDSPECMSNIPGFISTGVSTLDLAIGRGGWPLGRCSSLVGNPGSGKSSLVYATLTGVQQRNGVAVLVDSEFSLEKSRAQSVGVDISKLVLFQGVQLEDFVPLLEQVIAYRNSKDPDTILCVAYDTVSALPSESDLSVSSGLPQPGFHARYLSFAFRRLVQKIAREKVAVILVHQPRTKIATMGYGSTLTWIGHLPTTFYSSVIVQLTKFRDLKQGQEPVGIEVIAKVIRNKIAPPLRTAHFNVLFDSGVDAITPILQILQNAGKVVKRGGWYTSWDGTKFTVKDFKAYYEAHREVIDSYVAEYFTSLNTADSSASMEPEIIRENEDILD